MDTDIHNKLDTIGNMVKTKLNSTQVSKQLQAIQNSIES